MANDSKDSSLQSTSRGNCTRQGSGAFQIVGYLFIKAGVILIASKFNLSVRVGITCLPRSLSTASNLRWLNDYRARKIGVLWRSHDNRTV